MTPPDSGEREVPLSLQQVHLPIRLAQRILAALEDEQHHYEAVGILRAARKLEALAAELREVMGK